MLPSLDVLCVFGRPIEKVEGTWKLSAYFERLSETGGHTGVRDSNIDPNTDDACIVVAGAEVNALGCAALFNTFYEENREPRVVMFSAGRPPYLRNDPDPDLNEAQFFKRAFLENAKSRACTELVLQTQNINSYGDVVETLRFAKNRTLHAVGFVTLTMHMARCREFFRFALERNPAFRDINVHWFASEPLVLQSFPEEYAFLWEAMISKAYVRTAERERQGILDLRSERYNFEAPGYRIEPEKT